MVILHSYVGLPTRMFHPKKDGSPNKSTHFQAQAGDVCASRKARHGAEVQTLGESLDLKTHWMGQRKG